MRGVSYFYGVRRREGGRRRGGRGWMEGEGGRLYSEVRVGFKVRRCGEFFI